jgi:hypothetical protein
MPFVSARSPEVSLRVVDWLVTNYAKRYDVTLQFGEDGSKPERMVNLHHEYRAWLHVWRRKLFDPFARRSRIFFRVDGEFHTTTVAQLNFLLFAHRLGVIDYVTEHISEIEGDMNQILRSRRGGGATDSTTAPPTKRRRTELSSAPATSCGIFEVQCEVRWGEER